MTPLVPHSQIGAPTVTAAAGALIPVASPYLLAGGIIFPTSISVSDLMLRSPSVQECFSGDDGIRVRNYAAPFVAHPLSSTHFQTFGFSDSSPPPSASLLLPEMAQLNSYGSDFRLQSPSDSSSHIPASSCPPFVVDPSPCASFFPLSPCANPSPLVFVSSAGLLTVVMRNDVTVEMTLDRSVRVVNHLQKAVVATNSRGDVSCVYHIAAKILQDRTTTEMTVYNERRVRMTTSEISFAHDSRSPPYTLTPFGLKAKPDCVFSDLSKDMSVTLLFSSSGYGPHLMAQCDEVTQASRYRYHRNGAVTVIINGVRIHQTLQSDVIVSSSRKYLRVSPRTGLARVVTHFVELTVEGSRAVRMRRGGHRVLATPSVLILANDDVEFGFDEYHQLFLNPVTVKRETIIYKGRRVFRGGDCLDRCMDSPPPSQCRVWSDDAVSTSLFLNDANYF